MRIALFLKEKSRQQKIRSFQFSHFFDRWFFFLFLLLLISLLLVLRLFYYCVQLLLCFSRVCSYTRILTVCVCVYINARYICYFFRSIYTRVVIKACDFMKRHNVGNILNLIAINCVNNKFKSFASISRVCFSITFCCSIGFFSKNSCS